ncbi:hypothetical protein [Paenibacillus wynnii]|uniref:Uncharacterized protein n=1 Tax=Paenibacillus wynnii TaxID=268407 RepID=A0A098M3U6_9BACL|nr:hypothetical protein [Paenibacillus wynnii]KGE17225.1 hypothetical protein PWYN_21595 [Paenibacillus wynnii]
METNDSHMNVKKRMMFSTEDDYYYFVYNSIVFLHTLGFTSEKNRLQEWTKLNYLIPFISNHALINMIQTYKSLGKSASTLDKELLKETYIKSRLRLNWTGSLFFALEQKGIFSMKKNDKRKSFDVWLCPENVSNEFKNCEMFQTEKQHSLQIKQMFSYIKTMKTDSLLDELFRNRGVKIWGD